MPRLQGVASVGPQARVAIVTGSGDVTSHAPASAVAKHAPAVDGVRTLDEGFALPAVTAPADVPDGMGALIYCDEADGDLKVRFANGTVATLATN